MDNPTDDCNGFKTFVVNVDVNDDKIDGIKGYKFIFPEISTSILLIPDKNLLMSLGLKLSSNNLFFA